MIIETYSSHALCTVWASSFSARFVCWIIIFRGLEAFAQETYTTTKGRDLVQPKTHYVSKTSNGPHGNAQAPHVAAKYPKRKLGKLQCSRFCAAILDWNPFVLDICMVSQFSQSMLRYASYLPGHGASRKRWHVLASWKGLASPFSSNKQSLNSIDLSFFTGSTPAVPQKDTGCFAAGGCMCHKTDS